MELLLRNTIFNWQWFERSEKVETFLPVISFLMSKIISLRGKIVHLNVWLAELQWSKLFWNVCWQIFGIWRAQTNLCVPFFLVRLEKHFRSMVQQWRPKVKFSKSILFHQWPWIVRLSPNVFIKMGEFFPQMLSVLHDSPSVAWNKVSVQVRYWFRSFTFGSHLWAHGGIQTKHHEGEDDESDPDTCEIGHWP